MSKIERYESFNESRRSRNKGGNNRSGRFQHDNSWKDSLPSSVVDRVGLPMKFSERFKYILNKIALKNNAIAKELIELPNKTDAFFQYSYLDIEGEDNVSYLNSSDKRIPEEDRYKTPKRQRSKIYKIVKTIFGSKYTKIDVNKFVSMYKTVYKQGPDNVDLSNNTKTIEQFMSKLTDDTKKGKIIWTKGKSIKDMDKYLAMYEITDKKSLNFEFFRFFNEHESVSMIIVVLINAMAKNENDKRIHIETIKEEYLKEFFPVFVEKYEKNKK